MLWNNLHSRMTSQQARENIIHSKKEHKGQLTRSLSSSHLGQQATAAAAALAKLTKPFLRLEDHRSACAYRCVTKKR